MKLSEMKQILASGQIRLTRSLGQNFLHDANQLRRMVGAAELSSSDKVLEIGPGLGPLTELLLAQAGEVLAIEKDARLIELLGDLVHDRPDSSPSPPGSRTLSGLEERAGERRSLSQARHAVFTLLHE